MRITRVFAGSGTGIGADILCSLGVDVTEYMKVHEWLSELMSVSTQRWLSELRDGFVVNRCDREWALDTFADLRYMARDRRA